MNKFCFEIYEFNERGRIFKGYKTVLAESTEQAQLCCQDSFDNSHQFCQVFIPSP